MFRRWSVRYRYEGLEGLNQCASRPHNQASPEEVEALETLYRKRYGSCNVRHFYYRYRDEHGGTRSYNWVREQLQAAGLVERGHRNSSSENGGDGTRPTPRRRESREGALLHEAGRKDEWVAGHHWDLVLMFDDATRRVCAGIFAPDPCFWARVRCVRETVERRGFLTLWLPVDAAATGIVGWEPDRDGAREASSRGSWMNWVSGSFHM